MSTCNKCQHCSAQLLEGDNAGLCPACLLKAGLESDTAQATAAFHGFTPPSLDELRPLFPNLEIIELIGQGGMGAVYKARQSSLDRLVALKILPPTVNPAFTERFQREAKLLAKLSHPGIVTIFEFGQAGEHYFIVMEFVDGVNLRQAQTANKLQPAEALAIVPKICDALQYAHEAGVVHRDIKPENILLDTKGRVKIADFGLGKLLNRPEDTRLSGPQQVMGTPHYMAPEQWEKPNAVDHRADIYSLGVVFYELLTGELPVGRFAPPSQKAGVDVRLDDIVLRTLEKEPERRYQHVSEVKTEVDKISAEAVEQLSADEISRALQQVPGKMKELKSLQQRLAVRGAILNMEDLKKRRPELFVPWSKRKRMIAAGLWGLVMLFVIAHGFWSGFDETGPPLLANFDFIVAIVVIASSVDAYLVWQFPKWKSVAEDASLMNKPMGMGCWFLLAALAAFAVLGIWGKVSKNIGLSTAANCFFLAMFVGPWLWRLWVWLFMPVSRKVIQP